MLLFLLFSYVFSWEWRVVGDGGVVVGVVIVGVGDVGGVGGGGVMV